MYIVLQWSLDYKTTPQGGSYIIVGGLLIKERIKIMHIIIVLCNTHIVMFKRSWNLFQHVLMFIVMH